MVLWRQALLVSVSTLFVFSTGVFVTRNFYTNEIDIFMSAGGIAVAAIMGFVFFAATFEKFSALYYLALAAILPVCSWLFLMVGFDYKELVYFKTLFVTVPASAFLAWSGIAQIKEPLFAHLEKNGVGFSKQEVTRILLLEYSVILLPILIFVWIPLL
ncbi:MAG: hypothetical protein A2939_04515 [Parcubacteria group bacterium RIFCSPLOWO2_01_FULL_48_18]|nr:MAG: hypothetical protein A3J67_02220 [Parcubacteria group bacterium RIFCSPHIGHO2_02_FULL_48_10b]OHB22296.1 MAG: hypothetical protein A2939_04515 [Parcubacteria group bacterium RIFCSPLOWO2_01_FULL_48_18]